MKKRKWRARRDSNSRPSGSKRNFGLAAVQPPTTKCNKTRGIRPFALLRFVPVCMAFSDRSRTVDLPAGHRVRKLETIKAKRATKRELIVVNRGSHHHEPTNGWNPCVSDRPVALKTDEWSFR